MNRNVGSTASLMMVAAMPYRSMMGCPEMDRRATQRIDPDFHS